MLRGIDVILYERHKTGEDAFHTPVYEETPVTVHNVLVGEPDAAAVVSELQLNGRRLAYVLALPKGDEHDWANAAVEFFGPAAGLMINRWCICRSPLSVYGPGCFT